MPEAKTPKTGSRGSKSEKPPPSPAGPKSTAEKDKPTGDQAIIDHLTSGPLKPQMDHGGLEGHRHFDEGKGRDLQDALGKDWKEEEEGGLPDF
jgi:hypothetical protein